MSLLRFRSHLVIHWDGESAYNFVIRQVSELRHVNTRQLQQNAGCESKREHSLRAPSKAAGALRRERPLSRRVGIDGTRWIGFSLKR